VDGLKPDVSDERMQLSKIIKPKHKYFLLFPPSALKFFFSRSRRLRRSDDIAFEKINACFCECLHKLFRDDEP